jgi:hypothetical protein
MYSLVCRAAVLRGTPVCDSGQADATSVLVNAVQHLLTIQGQPARRHVSSQTTADQRLRGHFPMPTPI